MSKRTYRPRHTHHSEFLTRTLMAREAAQCIAGLRSALAHVVNPTTPKAGATMLENAAYWQTEYDRVYRAALAAGVRPDRWASTVAYELSVVS